MLSLSFSHTHTFSSLNISRVTLNSANEKRQNTGEREAKLAMQSEDLEGQTEKFGKVINKGHHMTSGLGLVWFCFAFVPSFFDLMSHVAYECLIT